MLDVPTKPFQYTNSTRYPDSPQYPSAVFQTRTPHPQYYYYYSLSSNSGSISSAAASGQSSLQPKENSIKLQSNKSQQSIYTVSKSENEGFTLGAIVEFSDCIEKPLKISRKCAGIYEDQNETKVAANWKRKKKWGKRRKTKRKRTFQIIVDVDSSSSNRHDWSREELSESAGF